MVLRSNTDDPPTWCIPDYRDNDITPTPAQAEADAAKAAANDLLADIRNSLRDPNAGKATVTIP